MDPPFGDDYDLMFQIVREQMMRRGAERGVHPLFIRFQRDASNADRVTVVLGRSTQSPVGGLGLSSAQLPPPQLPAESPLLPLMDDIGPLILQALVLQAFMGDHRHNMAAPLDPSTLRELQRMRLSNDIIKQLEAEGQGVCSICQEAFTSSDYVYRLPCGHLFDLACLEQWMQRTRTCPNCRFLLQDVEQQYRDAATPLWWVCGGTEKSNGPDASSEEVVEQAKPTGENASQAHAEARQALPQRNTTPRSSSGVTATARSSFSGFLNTPPHTLRSGSMDMTDPDRQNEPDESTSRILPILPRLPHPNQERASCEETPHSQQVLAEEEEEPHPVIMVTRVPVTPPRRPDSGRVANQTGGRSAIRSDERLPLLSDAYPAVLSPFVAPRAQENSAADHRRRGREWTPARVSSSISNSSEDVHRVPRTPPRTVQNESIRPAAGNAQHAVRAIRRYRVETVGPRRPTVPAARSSARPNPPPLERPHRPAGDPRSHNARHGSSTANVSGQRGSGNAEHGGPAVSSAANGQANAGTLDRRRYSAARGSGANGNLAQYEAIIRGQLRFPRGH